MIQQSGDVALAVSNGVSGTAYTPSITDTGRVLETSNGSAVTVTIPVVSVAGWRLGTMIQICQYGAGQVTVAGAVGVALRASGGKLKTAAQYAVISLRMRANDEWVISGDAAV